MAQTFSFVQISILLGTNMRGGGGKVPIVKQKFIVFDRQVRKKNKVLNSLLYFKSISFLLQSIYRYTSSSVLNLKRLINNYKTEMTRIIICPRHFTVAK